MIDEPGLQAVLSWTSQLQTQLGSNAEKLKATASALTAARKQAAPHHVHHQDVSVDHRCKGRGCLHCHNAGVVHTSGTPFRAPSSSTTRPSSSTSSSTTGPSAPPRPASISEREQTLAEAAEAQQRLRRLAVGFGRLAVRLERAAATAHKIVAHLETIVGDKAR